jgi:hypothetical protein
MPDHDDDDETEPDLTLAEIGLDEIPTMDDPELDEQMKRVDPRAPLPQFTGPDVDLNPEPDGRPQLSPEERRTAFASMLAELMIAGQVELSTAEILQAWYQRVGEVQGNQRAFLHELLNDWIEQGQIERVGHGRYRLVTLAEVGNP